MKSQQGVTQENLEAWAAAMYTQVEIRDHSSGWFSSQKRCVKGSEF